MGFDSSIRPAPGRRRDILLRGKKRIRLEHLSGKGRRDLDFQLAQVTIAN
jgi:hypothetical protein